MSSCRMKATYVDEIEVQTYTLLNPFDGEDSGEIRYNVYFTFCASFRCGWKFDKHLPEWPFFNCLTISLKDRLEDYFNYANTCSRGQVTAWVHSVWEQFIDYLTFNLLYNSISFYYWLILLTGVADGVRKRECLLEIDNL